HSPGRLARRPLPRGGRRGCGSKPEAQLARGGRVVNRQHLKAFVWLRWRLLVNQLKRGGLANVVLLILAAIAASILVGFLFLVFFFVGLVPLAKASPAFVMYVWDGLVVGFLFCWMIGLITVLQRSEVLSLDKFLHLPVSLAGVFFLNYLSSLVSLTLLVFF